MKTKVCFINRPNDYNNYPVLAVFPDIKGSRRYRKSYSIGFGFGEASLALFDFGNARKADYMPLYNELTAMGYNLTVVKGWK